MSRSKDSKRKLLQSRDTYATPLVVILMDTYGPESLQWDAETIRMELQSDFNLQLARGILDRLMAGIAILTSDRFFKLTPDFIMLCNVLSGSTFDPTTFDPADAEECAWGISEAMLLNPPEEDDPFSPEICRYIGVVLDQEGIMVPPDVLKIAVRPEAANVQGDFADDPVMFNAIFDMERSKTDEINAIIREGVQALLRQLSSLVLENGTTEQLIQSITANGSSNGRSEDQAASN
jgi:hypothetical protein